MNCRTQNRDRLPGRRRLNNRPLGGPLTRQRAIRFQGDIIRRRLGRIRWSLSTGRRRRNPPEECEVPLPPCPTEWLGGIQTIQRPPDTQLGRPQAKFSFCDITNVSLI